ncbi:hypothetical protein IMSHALPRED_007113 [Imshaugia aleurites]|uniref:FAD-binding domain-containing protein n=1 Tax=Imshaugia aleurites TaxID=172621 RepID=A0A8H3IUG8_9LECA|nr:hypothetical protein IMSHALPRED_007113 [Imshaugia aleurites]
MDNKPKSVLIAGGSLAGLMTGIVLKHLGHHVRIFERYPATQMEGQGAGITAQVDVQQLLTDYGLLKPPYSVNSPNLQILKLDGSVKSTWNVAWEMTSWDALYFRLRAVFDGHRSEYCPQALELGAQQTGSGENPRKRDTRPSICRAIRASHLDGKVLLVGDALASFRPHAALSTNQAALNALLRGKVMKGEMALMDWQRTVLKYAHVSAARSRAIGTYFQGGWGVFLVALVRYGVALVGEG